MTKSERELKQRLAVIELGNGVPITKTARRIGVHQNTLHNWLKNSYFSAKVKAYKDFIEDNPEIMSQIFDEALGCGA